jgi:ethanolamine ammonia-lyase large subunit
MASGRPGKGYETLLVYSLKSHDQLAGASAANRECRVAAVGMSFSQLAIRPMLTAVGVASS